MGQAKKRGTYEDRVKQAKAQGRGWSEKHYNSLTDSQHKANNEWFNKMSSMLKPGGVVAVPNLGKTFTSDGEETA